MAPPKSSFKKLGKKQKKRRISDIWKNLEISVRPSLSPKCQIEVRDRSRIDSNSDLSYPESSNIGENNTNHSNIVNNVSSENEDFNFNHFDNTSEERSSASSDSDENISCEFGNKPSLNTESIIEENEKRTCSNNCDEFLRSKLTTWIKNEKQVPHASLDRLLKLLGENFDIPKSTKTLLGNSCNFEITEMGTGEYL